MNNIEHSKYVSIDIYEVLDRYNNLDIKTKCLLLTTAINLSVYRFNIEPEIINYYINNNLISTVNFNAALEILYDMNDAISRHFKYYSENMFEDYYFYRWVDKPNTLILKSIR